MYASNLSRRNGTPRAAGTYLIRPTHRSFLNLHLYEIAAPLLVCAAFVSSWNGLALGGIQPVDLFLGVAFVLIVVDALSSKTEALLPAWVTIPAILMFFVAASHVLFPTPRYYLTNRFELNGLNGGQVEYSESPMITAVKWLVALVILPALVSYVGQRDSRIIRRVALAWMFGAVVSSLVAVSDFVGTTSIGEGLVGYVNSSSRQSGLASHANNLGVACAIAIPIALYLFQTRRLMATLSVIILMVGAFMSGSRGAQVASAIALLLTLIIARRTRRIVLRLIIFVAVVIFLGSLLIPDLIAEAQVLLRFGDNDVADSNFGRTHIALQALDDFYYSPFIGIGLEVITYAHSVPLQLLSAGGLVLALSFYMFWYKLVRAGYAMRNDHGHLAGVAVVSILVWLAVGIIENQLTDRYLYFPVAVIVTLWMARKRRLKSELEATQRAKSRKGTPTGR